MRPAGARTEAGRTIIESNAAAAERAALAALQSATAPPGTSWRYGDGPDQLAELFGPDDGPLVIVVHGGYFRPGIDRTHARPQAHGLAEAGYRVVLAEYRRTPGAPEQAVEDLSSLDAALRDRGRTPAAAWVGHSAGGALVLLRALATDLPPVPVLALAPVADLGIATRDGLGDGAVPAWLGGLPVEVPERYARFDPQAALRDLVDVGAGLPAPVTALHGDRDATVPVELTQNLPDVPGLHRRVLTGVHHFDVVDPRSPHWPVVVQELALLTGR